jgi:Icc-related predicted phosphoesterase
MDLDEVILLLIFLNSDLLYINLTLNSFSLSSIVFIIFDHLNNYDYVHNMEEDPLEIHEELHQYYKNLMKNYTIYFLLFMVPYNLDYHNGYLHYLPP